MHHNIFDNKEDYQKYRKTNNFETPNVSYCIDEDKVYYEQIIDYSKEYLTFNVLTSGTVSFTAPNNTSEYIPSISYSLDGGETWVKTVNTNSEFWINIYVSEGDTILWKANCKATGHARGPQQSSVFISSANCNVSGNIMSLCYEDDFIGQTNIPNTGQDDFSGFCWLFGRSSIDDRGVFRVVSAKNLILPATNLTDQCYLGMFRGCSTLIEAPSLPATVLKFQCYANMFERCTSLTTAPVLPATILATSCYSNMFTGCTSLTKAPELPAIELVQGCYHSMFNGCSKLNYIKALFTTSPGTNYTYNWVQGVSSTGTFVKNAEATWDVEGVDSIPAYWTVELASE